MNKVKRVAAITGIVLIASMYLISFLSSFFATEYSNGLFIASIFSTVVIPIIIWWFIAMYRWVHRNEEAPPNNEDINPEDGNVSHVNFDLTDNIVSDDIIDSADDIVSDDNIGSTDDIISNDDIGSTDDIISNDNTGSTDDITNN